MRLFTLLVIAHLAADFPLQCAAVYRWKTRTLAGQLPHALISLAAMAAAGYPLLGVPGYVGFILAVAGSHLLIDAAKISWFDRAGPGWALPIFLLDQALHLLAISLVFLTPLPRAPELSSSALGRLGTGPLAVAALFLAAAFAGSYILAALRMSLGGEWRREAAGGAFLRRYGIAERAALFSVLAAGGWWAALVPVIVALRLPIANRRAKAFRPEPLLLSWRDVLLNLVFPALCALGARVVLR